MSSVGVPTQGAFVLFVTCKVRLSICSQFLYHGGQIGTQMLSVPNSAANSALHPVALGAILGIPIL